MAGPAKATGEELHFSLGPPWRPGVPATKAHLLSVLHSGRRLSAGERVIAGGRSSVAVDRNTGDDVPARLLLIDERLLAALVVYVEDLPG